MGLKDKTQLKLEIDHIFDSGANELRIYDMVVNFIDKRNNVKNNYSQDDIKSKMIGAFKIKLDDCINDTHLTVDNTNIILKVDKNTFRIRNNFSTKGFIMFNSISEDITEKEFSYLHFLASKRYNKITADDTNENRNKDIEILNNYLK